MDVLVFLYWYPLRSIHCEYYGSNCCVAAVVCLACEDICWVMDVLVFLYWYPLISIHCEYYGINCSVAAVVCLACENKLLGYGCVGAF